MYANTQQIEELSKWVVEDLKGHDIVHYLDFRGQPGFESVVKDTTDVPVIENVPENITVVEKPDTVNLEMTEDDSVSLDMKCFDYILPDEVLNENIKKGCEHLDG